jgi:ABC-type multidrug transport system permease subunit
MTDQPKHFADRPLVQLTMARLREFLREPEAVFWVLIFPILLAAGLGLAFRARGPEVLPVGVAPGVADTVAKALRADRALTVETLGDTAAASALRTGRIALLVVPAANGAVEYRFDEARQEARTARLVVDHIVQGASGRRDAVPVTDRLVTERGSRYIDFVLPGLLGMYLMGSGIWGIGFAIVDARKKKLLKRLVATPMSRGEYLASFLISRMTMLVLELVTVVGFGVLVFGVPMRGSLLAFSVIAVVSAHAFGGLGLLVASRARTTEGASGLMNLVMVPMWVFSGVFFSASRYPKSVQPFIQALPLTAVNDALRANMLQGAGWSALTGELTIITAWLVISFALALRLFRWR